MRKPYYKKSHDCWYVTDAETRQEIRLDPDEEKAFDLWSVMRDQVTNVTRMYLFDAWPMSGQKPTLRLA